MELTNRVVNFVRLQLFQARYHMDLVRKWQIYYGSPHAREYRHVHADRLFMHITYPAIHSFLSLLRSGIFVYSQKYRILGYERYKYYTGSMGFPDSVAVEIEITFAFWSVLNMIHILLILPTKLEGLSYMAPMVIEVGGRVSPEMVQLSQSGFEKVRGVRKMFMKLYDSMVYSLVFMPAFYVYRLVQVFNECSLLEKLVSAFMNFTITLWAAYTCFTTYGLLLILATNMNYTIQKLIPIQEQLNFLYKTNTKRVYFRLWRVYRIMRNQSRMMLEIAEYAKYIEPVMTLKFVMYSMLNAYLGYIILYGTMDALFVVFFYWLGAGHVVIIVTLINRCTKIERHNRIVGKALLRVYNRGFNRKCQTTSLIKLQTNIFSLVRVTSGYKMLDGIHLNSTCYVLIAYNISVFFFLIFSK